MINSDSPLGLMVWMMNFFADTFGNSAILKGGMELRLLDCPRHTNDIDYVFVPYDSKKDVCTLVLDALRQVPELHVEHSLNSKCLRCRCEVNGIRIQIEVTAAVSCESQELTTASLARATNQQGRIVRGMRFDVALANKIAAWNERNLIRDLYDCYFMIEVLAVKPHLPTLMSRLSSTEIRSGRKSIKTTMTTTDLTKKLITAMTTLTQSDVEEQLRDYFPPTELPGLEMKIRIGVNRLIALLKDDA